MVTIPRFFFFDVGNVLVQFSHERSRDQIASILELDPRQVQRVVFEEGLQERYESGEVSCQQFAEQLICFSETQVAHRNVVEAASRIFALNRELIPLLTALRTVNLPLGILSNTCPGHWQEVLRIAPLIQSYFRHFVLSHESKCMKPNSKIYQDAIRLAGEPAELIFFVDDRPENVEAARLAGLDAHQYESADRLFKALDERGVRLNF
ncbi:MAG: HAD family phosphatase [Planctomycetota bacterium]|nr:HAD family phosphatase [Planctomycetota bacterium]